MKRSDTEQSITYKRMTPCGNVYTTVSYKSDGRPVEMFVHTASLRTDRQMECDWSLNAIALAASKFLQLDEDVDSVCKYLGTQFRCPASSAQGLATCPEHMNTILREVANAKLQRDEQAEETQGTDELPASDTAGGIQRKEDDSGMGKTEPGPVGPSGEVTEPGAEPDEGERETSGNTGDSNEDHGGETSS